MSAPPTNAVEGARHIVAGVGTNDWAGQGARIAIREGGVWVFETPLPGWQAYVEADGEIVVFDAVQGWQSLRHTDLSVNELGINATPDSVNRFAVSAAASLLSHEGAGHQVKINKAAPGDTASLVFQTGFSGRAEMGTAGSDEFAIKVSADGTTWSTGLEFAPATGRASAPAGLNVTGPLGGTAVTQSGTDTTPGRVIRTEDGYVRGTILGVVSQSAGVPTGAVIEAGSTANGQYTRFADGTQICTSSALATGPIVASAGALFQSATLTWNFPIAFAPGSVPVVSGEGDNTGAWPTIGSHGAINVSFKGLGVVPYANGLNMRLMAVGRWL